MASATKNVTTFLIKKPLLSAAIIAGLHIFALPAHAQDTTEQAQNTQINIQQIDQSIETMGSNQQNGDMVTQPQTPLLTAQEEAQDQQIESRKTIPHSGLYYDSDAIAPDPQLGRRANPREVDPKFEPGSGFVVVQKNSGAHGFSAQMVAADRALKLERYAAALELYEKLYKKSPKNPQILMGLAIAQQKSGFQESAIATYEELLKHYPNNTEATVNMLGIIKQQYPAVAYRRLKDLWDKNGKNPAIAAQLGLSSAQNGDTSQALQYLAIAASIEPNNAQHYYNLAIIADRAGSAKEAMTYYEKSLEVDVVYGNSRSIPRDLVYDRLAQLRRL